MITGADVLTRSLSELGGNLLSPFPSSGKEGLISELFFLTTSFCISNPCPRAGITVWAVTRRSKEEEQGGGARKRNKEEEEQVRGRFFSSPTAGCACVCV